MHCKENETENGNNPSNPGSKEMNVNPTLSIVEIPMTKVETTISFYEKTFQTKIERMTMGDTELTVFPSDGKTVSIVLTKGEGYIPSNKGMLVYFNAGEDLQPILSSVAKNGGKVVLEKTEISPEMGYFALFMDPEGNQIGLHSKK
ncbi:VOC family protein [Leptospira jelokensis]|uniref:VOC family protein n=2 Tax=Leptospira jelokensis TaxID=2484931 RepID=A0A4Z0ZWB8_9LEPT|nr:VOC family protein [Leptospira jelokensis]